MKSMPFSIVIPAFNEEKIIAKVVNELKKYLDTKGYQAEIIVVDDNSKDSTYTALKKVDGIKLVRHPYNKGYGASLKTGAAQARYDWLLFYDADGQHQPKYIENLIEGCRDFDMIVGARVGYKGPWIRQPGKKILTWTAVYLTGKQIPDLNSGMRLVKKEKFFRYAHLLPNGFSLTTTITVAFLKDRLDIKYVPIKINRRKGQSVLKISDGFNAIMTALRITILFSPLRVFLPVSFVSFVLGVISSVHESYDFKKLSISDSGVVLFIASLLFFFFGLLADQTSAIRREYHNDRHFFTKLNEASNEEKNSSNL